MDRTTGVLRLEKVELDKAHKDKKCKIFPHDFAIELLFDVPDVRAPCFPLAPASIMEMLTFPFVLSVWVGTTVAASVGPRQGSGRG